MRVVVDTNVSVSRLLAPQGAPSQVFDAWEAERFDLMASDGILAEYLRVLSYPKIAAVLRLSDEARAQIVGTLRQLAILIEPQTRLRVVQDDPKDDRLVEAAVEGEAGYIVSGDKHLLRLGEYRGIQILSPTAFLELLRQLPE